ncbi:MAG: DUF669 domain-containing protein, partial [Butyricicoccaceae bacterium]
PGVYPFVVTKVERSRSKGSDKMPPCNMAVITLRVNDETTITENILMHTKFEWKLCQFFTSIGQRQHGERLRMNWGTVLGRTGRCEVGVRSYKKKDGSDGQANEIKKFVEPDAAPSTPQTSAPTQYAQTSTPQRRSWTPGAF